MSCKFSLHTLNVKEITCCMTFIPFHSWGNTHYKLSLLLSTEWIHAAKTWLFECIYFSYWQQNKGRKTWIHGHVYSDPSGWLNVKKQRPVDDSTFGSISQKKPPTMQQRIRSSKSQKSKKVGGKFTQLYMCNTSRHISYWATLKHPQNN